jgi:NAD(P)-dependent dehydrogenase (short-subunit alcohol dehydrogenase family)
MTLQDKTVLVVGGAGTIGSAVLARARQLGARTLAWDQRLRGQRPDTSLRLIDACSQEEVEQAFAELEGKGALPDVLINAAGLFSQLKPFTELDSAGLLQILEANAGSCFVTCRGLLRRKPEKVSIVNISSALASRPIPLAAAYSASKAAIDSLTRSIALEFADRGVRANAVNPGPVHGEMLQTGLTEMADQTGCQVSELEAGIRRGIPQARLITAEEVAGTALFLADDNVSGITGQTINVCGGYQL